MSHFVTLINLDPIDCTETKPIPFTVEQTAAINALKEQLAQNPNDYFAKYELKEFLRNPSPFELSAESLAEDIMLPYCENTEDPEYLEFNDVSAEVMESYKTECCDCVRFPEGRIVMCCDYNFYNKYEVVDGVIYQKSAGVLKHNKRTKKAKKLKFLPEYPIKKIFKSCEEYAQKCYGYNYDEDHEAYGYYNNPNAQWDWYQIGGRWPYEFLVKNGAEQIIIGERS